MLSKCTEKEEANSSLLEVNFEKDSVIGFTGGPTSSQAEAVQQCTVIKGNTKRVMVNKLRS